MSSFKRKLATNPLSSEFVQPEIGAFYSIQYDKQYVLLKVLAVDVDRKGIPTTVHTCIYNRIFDKRPFEISARGLYLSAEELHGQDLAPDAIVRRMLDDQGANRHRQFTYEGFMIRKPVFIASGTISEEEFRSYRVYLELDEYDEEAYYLGIKW